MKIPIDVQIAYVDQIEAAAQGWRDGVKTYCDFMEELSQMALNIYKAGIDSEPFKVDALRLCPDCFSRVTISGPCGEQGTI